MKKLAIFDLDGTLIDTPSGIVQAFMAVFEQLALPNPSDVAIRATIGMPLEVAFAELLQVKKEYSDVSKAISLYQESFNRLVLPRSRELIFPEAEEGLQQLQDLNIVMAIATSKYHKSAHALLEASGLLKFFGIIVGADDVSKPKPDPETGFLVFRSCGVAVEDAVMVGDTTHDILMAHGANIPSIAVTYGVHSEQQLRSVNPNWITNSFSEVVRLIRQ